MRLDALIIFYEILARNRSPHGTKNRLKIYQEYVLLLLGIILGDLGTFWHQFGTLLMLSGCTFGDLGWTFGGVWCRFLYFLVPSVVIRYIFQMIFHVGQLPAFGVTFC